MTLVLAFSISQVSLRSLFKCNIQEIQKWNCLACYIFFIGLLWNTNYTVPVKSAPNSKIQKFKRKNSQNNYNINNH